MNSHKHIRWSKITIFKIVLQFVIAAILAVAAAAPSSYKTKEDEYKEIVIVSQSDERNLDGSSQWRYSPEFWISNTEFLCVIFKSWWDVYICITK